MAEFPSIKFNLNQQSFHAINRAAMRHFLFETKQLICKVIFLLFFTHFAHAQPTECKDVFSRNEIQVAQVWMAHYFKNYRSGFSMRYNRARAVTGDPLNLGEDVISFGSGPDIFTPFIHYPLSKRAFIWWILLKAGEKGRGTY